MRTTCRWLVALLLSTAGCAHTLSPAARLNDEAAIKISQGNKSDAEVALKKSIALDPNLPWAHYNLGTCLQSRRAFTDAVAEFRRALDLFGQRDRHARSACLYGIAETLDDQNDFAKALKAYEDYLAFAGAAPEEANGVTLARARMKVMNEAITRGVPSGKPLRAPITPPPAPPPPAVAAPPPPPPPPVVAPEPPKPEPAKTPEPDKAKKGKKAKKAKKSK
jgi:tetratricopeptide (TPR) repeat protein